MQKKYITTLAMLGIALSPLFVMEAASLTELSQNYRPSLPANVNAGIDTTVELDTDADVEIEDSDIELNADANANARANGSLSDRLDISRRDLGDGEGRSVSSELRGTLDSRLNARLPNIPNTGTSSSATSTGMINARENANERAFEVASERSILLRAGEVSNESELRAFGLAAMEEDDNLNSISFDNDEVTVNYRAQGRFIGLLPVFLNVDVRVDQEGEVEIDYPWYGFLIAKDGDVLEEEVRAEIEALVTSRAEGGWTNSDRAELAAAIIQILRANYEANTATTTPEVED